ncbi:MAG: isocitrate lyase/phosphoenolpyruvate mutase family protein [Chitinophagales bacterium]
MTIDANQQSKAKELYRLHHTGSLLVLPNIWDPLGAALLEKLNFTAIATASAAIAWANGYQDKEKIPFERVLELLTRIVHSVSLPVTADIESGFADNDLQLQENMRRLLATGIVGINYEDTDKSANLILPKEIQSHRIRLIRSAASEQGVSLFINARTDTYLHPKLFDSAELRLEETIKRGEAYRSAGADGFYPIGMTNEQEIKKILENVHLPLNLVTTSGLPDFKLLQEMGVARVSLGPSLLKISIRAMKDLATKLRDLDGLSDIVNNEISSDYVKGLARLS